MPQVTIAKAKAILRSARETVPTLGVDADRLLEATCNLSVALQQSNYDAGIARLLALRKNLMSHKASLQAAGDQNYHVIILGINQRLDSIHHDLANRDLNNSVDILKGDYEIFRDMQVA